MPCHVDPARNVDDNAHATPRRPRMQCSPATRRSGSGQRGGGGHNNKPAASFTPIRTRRGRQRGEGGHRRDAGGHTDEVAGISLLPCSHPSAREGQAARRGWASTQCGRAQRRGSGDNPCCLVHSHSHERGRATRRGRAWHFVRPHLNSTRGGPRPCLLAPPWLSCLTASPLPV